jgi:hypothetical protein
MAQETSKPQVGAAPGTPATPSATPGEPSVLHRVEAIDRPQSRASAPPMRRHQSEPESDRSLEDGASIDDPTMAWDSTSGDEVQTGGRRTARRRPAGIPRPSSAANDDAPSIGGLLYALNQKPSRRPFEVAGFASGAWAILGVLLGWAMLAPELQRAPTFLEMLTRPTAITLAATICIPIALFWFLALLSWRAQELKLMSGALSEVAIRLVEPDKTAEKQITSVGKAVSRQIASMESGLERMLARSGEIEVLMHKEVSAIDRAYAQNEHRMRGLLDNLAGERDALLNTSDRVNASLRDLGTEIPGLIDRLGEQQAKLARYIEQAGQNLVTMETSLSSSADNIANMVGARAHELSTVLTDQTKALDATLLERTEHIAGLLTSQTEDVQSTIVERTTELQQLFNTFSGGLDKALGARTEGLQAVLEEYTRALDGALSNRQEALTGLLTTRQEAFDTQLVERTRALDDAFTQRLQVFDDSIVRSTIAVDSMVADKALALSSAMESHAKEIASVLGRQAGDLDEQLMHGVNAVRRASENVTRQSIKAIEGLANQADLLKNVSENLVNQISSVSGRFDQQGQTIMRAANALETANYRIDKTLQNRQQELTQTLDQLSSRTTEIDNVMRGYSTTLEGTFTEAEQRARQVGDQLTRSAEEQARFMQGELERLQATNTGNVDRSLADLRAKYADATREVSQEIGSLSSRFSESSDEIRRRAQRTLAEIEEEQARLRERLQELPEATRSSTEAMRATLQDQLKALDQLSSLTIREARRAEISSPLAPSQHRPQPAAAGRSISSLTQSLANEMAARHRPGELPIRSGATYAGPNAPVPPAPVRHAATTPNLPATAAQIAAAEQGREGWSLGDLLARASQDEETARGGALDVQAIARSLDSTTASAIWSRFRLGQRNFMVRSLYAPEGQVAFDEVQRRFKTDESFRQTVERYMADFEKMLRAADQRDPTGNEAQSCIVQDTGRVYLFLAHASGRLV